MPPRLKLMFILTPVTIGLVGLISGAWWSYQLEKKGREQYRRGQIKTACITVQSAIREAMTPRYGESSPSVEIGGPESIVPIVSTHREYLSDKVILAAQGVKEQSGLLLHRWGNPFRLQAPGEGEFPDVWSYGPDGENGTEDDIHGKADED